MPDIWLVRHGQAGEIMGDYDRLSELGAAQARAAGAAWRHIGTVDRALAGTMVRHQRTAEEFATTFGDLPARELDARWNEFDHQDVIRVAIAGGLAVPERGGDRAGFSRFFYDAMGRWAGGEHADEYAEPYAVFQARVEAGLEELVEGLDSGQTAVVFTSGGVISAVARKVWGLRPRTAFEINTALVNTGVTRVRVGQGRVSLATLNSHPQFHARPDLLTRS